MGEITKGHLAAVFTVFVWGNTFISTKLLLEDFSAVEILFLRFLLGYIALFCCSPRMITGTTKREEFTFALSGLSGVTLYFLCENYALSYTYASNVGVIISVAPFFTALIAKYWKKEECLRPSFFLGFALAVAGIVLISFNGVNTLKLDPLGDGLAVMAALVWGYYANLTRELSTYKISVVESTRSIFFYGLISMIPAIYFTDFRFGLERLYDGANLFNMLFLGLIASALCYGTWTYSVNILGAVKTSIYIYLSPVITVICSIIVLKEQITFLSICGITLAIIGLLVSQGALSYILRKLKKN